MDVSCVMLTWNSESYIERSLRSLMADLSTLRHEIFVVDNGSQDRTTTILREFEQRHPGAVVPLYLDRNTGTTHSRNLAFKRAQGRFICVLDSDVEVSSGAIERLINVLERDSRTGLAAPKLVYPNGNLQKSTDVFPTIATKIKRYFFLRWIEKRERDQRVQRTDPVEVDYAISAMWLFKREVLDRVGLLDERILYSPEDVDYCLRIRKAGWRIVYDPSAVCVHHTQEISRGFRLNQATVRHVQGLCYYFRKHRCFFRPPRF